MNVSVQRAEKSDRSVIRNLLELYQHDLSEYWPCELDEHGLYGYATLDYYWNELNYAAFIFWVDDNLAGFALINDKVCLPENERWMAQFFVLRRYRRQGVAGIAAKAIFDIMPGKWEIGQIPLNEPGRKFWEKTVHEYTGGKFNQTYLDNEVWRGSLQWFDNTHRDHK